MSGCGGGRVMKCGGVSKDGEMSRAGERARGTTRNRAAPRLSRHANPALSAHLRLK